MPRAANDSSRSNLLGLGLPGRVARQHPGDNLLSEAQEGVLISLGRPRQAAISSARSAEAEDELRVVGHLVRRPGWIPRQLDLDVLDARQLGGGAVDVLLDH